MDEKAAIIHARCTVAMIRAMALAAENQTSVQRGESVPYGRQDFENIIVEEGVHWNAIYGVLYK